MSADIAFARQVLDEMLPRAPLSKNGCHLGGHLLPAERVGGDLFCHTEDGHRVHFMVADAVGHGLGSTLLVFECRAIWRALSLGRLSLTERARLINNLLFEHTGAERFVACCAGTLDTLTGEIELVTAGVAPMFVCRTDGSIGLLEGLDPPFGIFPDLEFTTRNLALAEGDSAFLCTDGVLEWRGVDGEDYGQERVAEILRGSSSAGPEQVMSALFSDLLSFAGGVAQKDDACALMIQRAKTR